MQTSELRIPPKGYAALLIWTGLLAGVLLCILAQWLWLGWWFLLPLGASLWYVWRRGKRVVITVAPHQVCIARGRFFKSRTRLRTRAVYSYTTYATPLLRSMDCSILVCYTAGRLFILPPLANQDIALLQVVLQGEGAASPSPPDAI